MPYAATGIYTPVTGAENAAPGQVIRSATWNSIFTDLSSALTQVGQQTWLQTPRVIAVSGSFSVAIGDVFVFVNVPTPSITLPLASLKTSPVKLIGGNGTMFGSNHAVVVPSPGDIINGVSAFTLSTNYGIATFFPIPGGGGYIAELA